MDVQLKELLDKIKSEGINEAEALGRKIKEDAEKQASGIIAKAGKEADNIINSAKTAVSKFEASSRESLKQAGRDLVLSLENTIRELTASIILRETKAALTPEFLKEMIISILKNWKAGKEIDIEIMVSPEDGKKLDGLFMKKLSDELKSGITIKPAPDIEAGFKISEKNGSLYYDFSHGGISEILFSYLNTNLADYMKKAIKGE